MDSDQGKLFIGGISWETTEEKLTEHFGNYGQVLQTVVMRDKLTGRPRGFGFVAFADPSVLDRVLQDKHTIDGRTVEAKRALSREEQQNTSRSGNPGAGRSFGGGANVKTKKIFVGGLPPTLTEEEFRQYFEAYGIVTDVVVMYDQSTQRPRGFGFISFDTEDAVDRVLHKSFHELSGKLVEVKRALPKDSNPGSGGQSGGVGYQGYGASGAGYGSYDGRTQAAGGGFQGYGSVYGAQGYGNGAATGGYGAAGYGSAGGYGNQNVPNTGYGSGQLGGPKGQWNTQDPSGYGSAPSASNMGYRTETQYGAPVGGGGTAAPTVQYPTGASGYGNNEYGYGYGNQGSYGAARGNSNPGSNAYGTGSTGDQHGAGAGYMGGGYGDGNGNYASQGGQVGYGGGYGGAQTRQSQQQ